MTTPPCHADEPLPAAVREADAMLGMWAEMFRLRRIISGVEGAIETSDRTLRNLPNDEIRDMFYAALIRLTEPGGRPL